MHDQEPTSWQETTGVRPVEASRSTPQLASSQTSRRSGVSPEVFAQHLTPCLALVGGVGMGERERRDWLNAAYRALGDFTVEQIALGADEALRTADHPSKIVATIVRAINAERDGRYRPQASGIAPPVALPAPEGHRCTRDEAAEICKRYGVGSFAKQRAVDPSRPVAVPAFADPDRACRKPSDDDYRRLFGIDPAEERAKGEAIQAALLQTADAA